VAIPADRNCLELVARPGRFWCDDPVHWKPAGKTQTMPLAIYIGLEQSLGVALALSVMLMLVSVVLLGVLRRLEKKDHA